MTGFAAICSEKICEKRRSHIRGTYSRGICSEDDETVIFRSLDGNPYHVTFLAKPCAHYERPGLTDAATATDRSAQPKPAAQPASTSVG